MLYSYVMGRAIFFWVSRNQVGHEIGRETSWGEGGRRMYDVIESRHEIVYKITHLPLSLVFGRRCFPTADEGTGSGLFVCVERNDRTR